MSTLQYYFEDGSHVIFNKYTITNGVITDEKGKRMSYHKIGKYNLCTLRDDSGNKRGIRVCRAIASTKYGPPPTQKHTADHIDRNTENDIDDNIRWLCKSEQNTNQRRPGDYKSAFIVVRNGVEKTVKEWIDHLKNEINHMGREYTSGIIAQYARMKKHGFSYKEYPDLPGEVWKKIIGSGNDKGGGWEISNMNRVKYTTRDVENVLSGQRLGLDNGYPKIYINGKHVKCHILSFSTFFPEEYAAKKPGEMILHEEDDRMDFRPHKLRIGTKIENTTDAYNNGKYAGTKATRVKCASYIKNVFEKEHESQMDAIRYLKILGFDKASVSGIRMATGGKRKTAYGRTWELC